MMEKLTLAFRLVMAFVLLLNIINKHNCFYVPKTLSPSPSLQMNRKLVRKGVFSTWIVSLSLAELDEPNSQHSLGNVQGKQSDLSQKMTFPCLSFWGEFLIRCQKT